MWNRIIAVLMGIFTMAAMQRGLAKALGRFRPWMIHSTYDQSPTVVFHFPLLQDYITVDEYGWTMWEAG
jgi:hypothetical protein